MYDVFTIVKTHKKYTGMSFEFENEICGYYETEAMAKENMQMYTQRSEYYPDCRFRVGRVTVLEEND